MTKVSEKPKLQCTICGKLFASQGLKAHTARCKMNNESWSSRQKTPNDDSDGNLSREKNECGTQKQTANLLQTFTDQQQFLDQIHEKKHRK
jgi:hypothetical protein